MPIYGELEVQAHAGRLTRMASLDTEAWTLPKAEILQLSFEVNTGTLAMLPRAMHPAVPPYATVTVGRYPESPVGPFALAQARLVGRAGAHPRGLILGAVASTEPATEALRARWGVPARTGPVTLVRFHDRIVGRAMLDGEMVLDAALVDPEAISPADVQYIASVTLGEVLDEGALRTWIVQVDPHYTLERAERGRAHVSRFVPAAWNADGLELVHPIVASVTTSDTDLPQIRFVMDPEVPVVRGTRRLR